MEQIKELTNCLKPCRYKKYSFAADGQKTIFRSEKYVFSMFGSVVAHHRPLGSPSGFLQKL